MAERNFVCVFAYTIAKVQRVVISVMVVQLFLWLQAPQRSKGRKGRIFFAERELAGDKNYYEGTSFLARRAIEHCLGAALSLCKSASTPIQPPGVRGGTVAPTLSDDIVLAADVKFLLYGDSHTEILVSLLPPYWLCQPPGRALLRWHRQPRWWWLSWQQRRLRRWGGLNGGRGGDFCKSELLVGRWGTAIGKLIIITTTMTMTIEISQVPDLPAQQMHWRGSLKVRSLCVNSR